MRLALPVLFIGRTMFVSSVVGARLTTVLAVLLLTRALTGLRPQDAVDEA